MNARLDANVIRKWKPGWVAGVRENSRAASDIPKRKRSNADIWLWCAVLLVLALVAAHG